MENKDYLKQLLTELKKPIPAQWRVQSFSKNKPVATVMAYIDARDAMDLLDEHCEYGWHRKHYVLDSKMYCEVGIVMPDGSIQWRSDCGTESNTDAEKGQSSDSFKRACVNFGIGRFLYDLPVKYIATNCKKETNTYPYCIDDQGKQIWDLTAHINKIPASGQPQQPAPEVAPQPKKTLSIDELADWKTKIDEIGSPIGLTGFYNSLSPELQSDKGMQGLLKNRREELKK